MVNFPILPEQASTFAERVDPMFWALSIFSVIFCVGITVILIALGTYYRQKHDGRKSIHLDNMPLELAWSVIPMVLALGIFAWGAVLFYDFATVPANTLDISVIGKQWMWKVQHPNGVREVNDLHIPVGQPVKLTMTSQDVIHSFYVPAFRVKQDVLPAKYTQLWFEATKVGTYPLFCAEYCGTQHSTMGGTIHVMEPSDYELWLSGGPALSPVASGEALFTQMGCVTCHDSGNASRGPILHGVFGSEVALKDGSRIVADEEYLRESILSPGSKIVEGYAALMPANFGSQLTDDDVLNLVAYIKSLGATK